MITEQLPNANTATQSTGFDHLLMTMMIIIDHLYINSRAIYIKDGRINIHVIKLGTIIYVYLMKTVVYW